MTDAFDPLWLRPDASLNRTRLAALPGAEPAWVGRRAFDLLGRDALRQLAKEVGDGAAADIFGRRLGHLIATLHAGADADETQSRWRRAYMAYWTTVEHVWLGGGLASALGPRLLVAARSEATRLGARRPSIELASYPAALPLVGAARSNGSATGRAVVLDFGHTAIKRGVATFSGRALDALKLLDPLPGPTPGSVVDVVLEVTAETLRAAGPDVDRLVVVSLASYVERSGRPVDSHSVYAPLGAFAPNDLQQALRRRTTSAVRLRLAHDGTLAARGVVDTTGRAAAIMLGTALGVGFCPTAGHLRPLARSFSVRGSA